MSENKRFINNGSMIFENKPSFREVLNSFEIVDLLNRLYEENVELKQEIQGYKDDRTRFEEEARIEAIDKALDEENEQLKALITSMGFTIKKENGSIIRLTKEYRK